MRTKLRRLSTAVLLTLGMLLSTVALATQASAVTYGWIYISAPTWLGNCAYGDLGRIIEWKAAVGNTWSGGDAGDDILYVKVRLNENQAVSYSGFCSKGRYPQTGVQQTIRPTRNNQTVWIGPAGVRYN